MPLATELIPTLNAMVTVVRNPQSPDLPMRQAALLMALAKKPETSPWSIREASDFLGISKPAVTRAVGRLQELGLITVKIDTKDRRLVILSVSPKGNQYLRTLAAGTSSQV